MEMKQLRAFKHWNIRMVGSLDKFMRMGLGQFRNNKWTLGMGRWKVIGEDIEELVQFKTWAETKIANMKSRLDEIEKK